jgi:hypothetical protein
MRSWGGGLGGSIVAVGGGLVAGALVAIAAVASIDFTGHWTGTATGKGSPVTLVADLTSTGRTVGGTFDATQDGQTQMCTVSGKQHGRSGFRAKLTPCKIALKGKFDATTNTISGHYVHHGHHKVETGMFMLTRGASPSGAFLDLR